MPDKKSVTHEEFSILLSWLDPDEESAAKRYETIRRRLIRVFAGRGCTEAEELADRTIDRVTMKAAELNGSYTGDPALYFYGVANNVFHEWCRQERRARNAVIPAQEVPDVEKNEAEYRCLEECLETMATNVRDMIIEYYRDDKRARIEHRREIAARMGITVGALQIRASRVRARLAECVRECVASAE